jgi:hypothetical protein
MTVTMFRGWIVILLLDVAVQQHDESFFGRLYLPRGLYRLRFRRRFELAVREMLIPPIQSKWDVGPRMVLGSCQPPATDLRKAKGRGDNMKP